MYKLLLTTQFWADEFARKELKDYFDVNFVTLDDGFYQVDVSDEKTLVDFILKFASYSRLFENIYLKIGECDEKLKKFNFEKKIFDNIKNKNLKFYVEDEEISKNILDKLSLNISDEFGFEQGEDLKFEVFDEEEDGYIIVLDLIGFNLQKRDYKVKAYEDSLEPIVVNFCLYSLFSNFSKDNVSILDPFAQAGDCIIESSLFLPRVPLNLKVRREFVVSKLFNLPFGIEKQEKSKSKFFGVASDKESFNYLKSNVVASNQKVKLSEFDFDWMDVKFHKGDFDFVITQFPFFDSEDEKNEFEKDFFYQSEFVADNEICVICESEINDEYLKKYKLNIYQKYEIEMEGEEYLIYIIGHD